MTKKKEMYSSGGYHGLIFCYAFILKMPWFHDWKKIQKHGGIVDPESQKLILSINNWMKPTEELLRSKGQPNDKLWLLQGVHHQSNRNTSAKLKKLVCGNIPATLWIRSFLSYMVQQYPHSTKISLHDYFLVINLNMHSEIFLLFFYDDWMFSLKCIKIYRHFSIIKYHLCKL